MKRDLRLRGLSSDHHHALVLAREVARRAPAWTAADGEALTRRFADELERHFRVEEEVLVPALRRAGEGALAERTETDHADLRRDAAAAGTGDGRAAERFAERLSAHVRWEERELFVACERVLDDETLAAVARRAPHPRPS